MKQNGSLEGPGLETGGWGGAFGLCFLGGVGEEGVGAVEEEFFAVFRLEACFDFDGCEGGRKRNAKKWERGPLPVHDYVR